MINRLIQLLKSSENFGNKFQSNDIHYTLLTSGGYRKYDKGRIVVIVFDGSEPRLVVKFYKNSNSISDEYETQTQIYKIYGNLITKPLGIVYLNDYKLMVEEPVLGKNLTRYVYENLNKHTLLEVFKLVFVFYKNLNSNLEISNNQNLIKEIDQIFQTFYSNFKISKSHVDMIENLRLVFLKNFENKKIFQRFSNNDFILNNFIINKNKLTLTDFEFSTKTHLYFLEWFQFFRYQWIISNDYIHDLTISEIVDPFYELGLIEFSNYKANEKFDLACRLIFEISDFVKRISISSQSTCKKLINDMEKLLNELNYRHNNPKTVQKKPNLDSSEKKFFHDEYNKLIQYKKNTVELINLRKDNAELRELVKALRKDNAELSKEVKALCKDNAELGKEIKKLRKHIDELRELVKALRKDNAELGKEVKALCKDNAELGKEIKKLRKHIDELRELVKALRKDNAELGKEVKALRKDNAELGKEVKALRKDNAELGKEIKRIILDHENYKKIVLADHENYKKIVLEDHENYIHSIESSLISKFGIDLDKLLGKKRS